MAEPNFNPFPGLRPFRTDEEYLFFGRDRQCQDLLRLLSKRRFIGVLGSSGTGKSSLVRAGLLPSLYRGGLVKAGSHWSVAICRPGGAPMRNLAHALRSSEIWDHLPEDHPIPKPLEIETVLQRSGMGVHEVAQMAQIPVEENLLIVVDQFEELFRFHKRTSTVEDRDTAEAFVNLLLEGAQDSRFSIHVVLTMRSGFFGDCASFDGLSEVINRGAYLVPRLTRDQLKEAIEGPAKVGGASMAPRLIQRLLNDAGGAPDELPVLQHALMRTWTKWQARDIPHEAIDLYHYEAIGGIQEALSRHADEVFLGLTEPDQALAERIFKTLTEKDPDNRGIRRPVSLEGLTGIVAHSDEDVQRVIGAFRHPEVCFLMPSADQSLRPDSIIDISHESLMRIWKRLGTWVDEETQSARIYQRLAETAALWEAGQADLYHDPDLQIARSWYETTRPGPLWAEQYGGRFSQAITFLEESQREKKAEEAAEKQARERELASANALAQEKARSARRSRRFSLILAGFSILLACLASAAYFAMRFARSQAQEALVARKAAEQARLVVSQNFSQSDYQFGQSAAEAGRFGEALAYLARALKSERGLSSAGDRIYSILTEVQLPVSHFFHQDPGDIETLTFTPDSREIVTASFDHTVHLWDIATNEEKAQWRLGDRAQVLAVSHNGALIACGSRDGDVTIVDRETGQPIGDPLVHPDDVNALRFSQDDKVILTGDDDGHVTIWNWATGNVLRQWQHERPINDVAFTADERQVVSVSDDDTGRVWDIVGNQESLTLPHEGNVLFVDVHPERSLIVTASVDHTAKVWAADTGECLATLRHDDTVREARFSPNGDFIGTCSHDRTVKLWDFAREEEIHRWAHRDAVDGIDFSPDGSLIASASDDQTVRIWETESGWESSVSPLLHRVDVDLARFSPDGKWLATVADSQVRVWRFADFREPPLHLTLPELTVGQLSPTGKWAAAGSATGRVSQWRTTDGVSRHPEVQHPAGITSIIYSPDGRWLVSGDQSGGVQVWEADTGAPVTLVPLTHDQAVTAMVMPTERHLLVASGNTVRSWNLPQGQPGPTLSTAAPITVMRGDANGRYLAIGCVDGATTISEAATLTVRHELSTSGAINSLDFYQDDWLATASDDWSARLWDLATGEPFLRPRGHGGEVLCIRFSPDGQQLITGSLDQRARMWWVESMDTTGRAFHHRNRVLSVGFSNDGTRAVTGSADQTARVWDVDDSLPLTQPLPHDAAVTHAQLTGGGRRLFTVAPGDGLYLWSVSLGAEGQLAPNLFLEMAEAIGGLQLSGNNQLIPLSPGKRRMILRKAETETRQINPGEDNAYLQFVRDFLVTHGPDLERSPRQAGRRQFPPGMRGPSRGPRPPRRNASPPRPLPTRPEEVPLQQEAPSTNPPFPLN